MSSLKNKTIGGIKWSFIDNIANSGITFLVGIFLARILSPKEFGILGLITVFIAISNTIVDSGFATALIRKNDTTDDDYNTVFYSNLAISLILIAIISLSAKSIATYFHEPVLQYVAPTMSLLLLFNAFSIIQKTLLIKNINFKTQAKISFIASTVSGCVGIAMALMNFGVWSLVGQQLSRQLLISVFLWLFSKWRPKFIFSKNSFNELFGFSSKILAANLINSIYQNIFLLIIGKMFSTEQLGKYTQADKFNAIVRNNLTMIIQKVSFPTLSSVQDEKERMTAIFRKIILYSAVVTFPLVFGLGAVAKPLIITLIGIKWLQSVDYLQIICFYSVVYPLSIINLNVLNIEGKSNLILRLEILKKLLFIPVFIVGLYWGLIAMLWAAVVFYYIEYFINSYYSERYFNYGFLKQIKDLFPILITSLLISTGMWSFTLLHINNFLILIFQITFGLILFPTIYQLINQREYIELKNLVLSKIGIIKKAS